MATKIKTISKEVYKKMRWDFVNTALELSLSYALLLFGSMGFFTSGVFLGIVTAYRRPEAVDFITFFGLGFWVVIVMGFSNVITKHQELKEKSMLLKLAKENLP